MDECMTVTAYIMHLLHRMHIISGSSSSPYFNVNPNTGENIVDQGRTKYVATNTIHLSPTEPSPVFSDECVIYTQVIYTRCTLFSNAQLMCFCRQVIKKCAVWAIVC